MTAGMPETVFKTDHQREYLLSWNANSKFDNRTVKWDHICISWV